MKRIACTLLPITMSALLVSVAPAQQRTGAKSTVLITKDVTGVPNREFRMLAVEFEAGGASGLHKHPGDESGTVIQGSVMVRIGDADYKAFTAGQTYSVPPLTPMDVKNTGTETAKVIAILIIEKGKPASEAVAR